MRTLYTTFLLTATLSQAAIVSYNSLSSWQAAGPQTAGIIDFSGLAGGQIASPLILNGFSFSSTSANNMLAYNPVATFTDLGAGVSLTSPANPGGISITLPTAVYAIGFLVGGHNQLALTLNGQTVLDNNGNAFTANFLPGAPTFIGFRSDSPITNLTIMAVGTGNRVSIDSVVWGGQAAPPEPPPAETPEAATAILIGFSLLSLPALKRRFGISSSDPHRLAH
jgi:hypothetical protein